MPDGQPAKTGRLPGSGPDPFSIAIGFLAAKLLFLVISTWSGYVSPIAGVPPMSDGARILALSFIGSSLVFTLMRTRFGFLSSVAFGLLTAFTSLLSLAGGQFVIWSALSLLTSAGLIVSVLIVWNRHGFLRSRA